MHAMLHMNIRCRICAWRWRRADGQGFLGNSGRLPASCSACYARLDGGALSCRQWVSNFQGLFSQLLWIILFLHGNSHRLHCFTLNAIRLIEQSDLIVLVKAAVGVVLRKDMSLNRRLYAWLLGKSSNRIVLHVRASVPDHYLTHFYVS